MVKTYVPQDIIDTYNKGKGIDAKEYEFITQGKQKPDWMHIPANGLSGTGIPGMNGAPDLGPPEAPDFSDVAPPMDPASLMPSGPNPLPPISPPPLPEPSVQPAPMIGSNNSPPPPMPMALRP